MPPKKRSTTPRSRSRTTDRKKAPASPTAAPLEAADGTSPGAAVTREDKRGREARAPAATDKRTAALTPQPAPSSPLLSICKKVAVVVIAVLLAVVVATTLASPSPWGGPVRGPRACSCATEAFQDLRGDDRQPLAALLMGSRSRMAGAHVVALSVADVHKAFGFMKACGHVEHVPAAVSTVDGLYTALRKGFMDHTCIVWLVPEAQIVPIAGPLKELMEDNALKGMPVVPPTGRGVFVIVSQKSREELKEVLPHRVVHMLKSVDLRRK